MQREHMAALQGTSPMDSGAHHIAPMGNTEIVKVLADTFDNDLTGITVLEEGYGTGFLIRRLLEAGVKKVVGIETVRSAGFLKELFHYDERVSLYSIDAMDLELTCAPWSECFSPVDAITCIIGLKGPSTEAIRMFFEVENVRAIVLLTPCSGFKAFVTTMLERHFSDPDATVYITAGRIVCVKLSGSGLPRHLWWMRKSKVESPCTRWGRRKMTKAVQCALLSSAK